MEQKDQKFIIVYTQKLCGYLQMNGFVLADMRPDKKDKTKNVFFFQNTPEINKVIDEYVGKMG